MAKADQYMPLRLGEHLAETAHLNNAMSGSYLHAKMWHWQHGALPADLMQCARIMKIEGPDAELVALAVLKQFFVSNKDSTWSHLGLDLERRRWDTRAKNLSERSIKANAARWKNHVRTTPTRTPQGDAKHDPRKTPSRTPTGSPSSNPASTPYVVPVFHEVQEQKHLRETEEVQEQTNLGVVPPPKRQRAKPLHGGRHEKTAAGRGKGKGRNPGEASRPSERSGRAPVGVRPSEGAKAPQKKRADPARNGADSGSTPRNGNQGVDPRFQPFRRELLTYWKHQNPEHPSYGWDEAEGRSLKNLLRRHPELSYTEFQQLLRNRAASDAVNPAEGLPRWIGRLMDYQPGPLDRYGKPK